MTSDITTTETIEELPEGMEASPETEESLQERFDKHVLEIQKRMGFSPRRAKRFLESMSRKKTKAVIKHGMKRKGMR